MAKAGAQVLAVEHMVGRLGDALLEIIEGAGLVRVDRELGAVATGRAILDRHLLLLALLLGLGPVHRFVEVRAALANGVLLLAGQARLAVLAAFPVNHGVERRAFAASHARLLIGAVQIVVAALLLVFLARHVHHVLASVLAVAVVELASTGAGAFLGVNVANGPAVARLASGRVSARLTLGAAIHAIALRSLYRGRFRGLAATFVPVVHHPLEFTGGVLHVHVFVGQDALDLVVVALVDHAVLE
jgi:hypothetical protein